MSNTACSVCGAPTERDSAAILTMGKYGNPRYLCSECEVLLDTATGGTDYDNIKEACRLLGKRLADSGSKDEATSDALAEIFERVSERARLIEEGEYDFSHDEEPEEELTDIPEELRESEEDRQLDEVEAKRSKLLDSIFTWITAGVFVGVIIFLILYFVV